MKNELFINGEDASIMYGVTLIDTSVDELLKPASMKDFVTNESRIDNGKRMVYDMPRLASRELTISFGILGADPFDFQTKKANFVALLQNEEIELYVPALGEEYYHLRFTKPATYAQSRTHTHCKMACKFIEANPADRTKRIE